MLSFPYSRSFVEKKFVSVQRLIEASSLRGDLSVPQISKLDIICMLFVSVRNEYVSSKQGHIDRKLALASLRGIEEDILEAMKMERP